MIIKFNQAPPGAGEHFRWIAIAVFFVAVVSDAVDGFIARRFNQITELGKALDPIADKLLLLSAIIILSFPGYLVKLPLWFIVTVLSRDVLILLGALMLYLFAEKGRLKIAPNLLGKATTVAQMTTVLWIMVGAPHAEYVWRTAGALTIASGIAYMGAASRQFNEPTAASK